MFNRPLKSFLPSVYDGIIEMDILMNAEENIMDIARKEILGAFSNTFVLTSDESGVIMFERMLNIVSNPQTEDLEFRKQRIINRLSMNPPFTFRFLKQKLNEIIGVGLWTSYIDFSNYTLYIESSAVNQNWYSEIEFTINRIKPCNMVFINVPSVSSGVNISEEISYTELNWRYRMGAWKLGQYSFGTLDGGGIVKMAEIKSIQQPLLNDTANFVANDVSYILLNNTIRISEFRLKQASNNTVTIEYNVTPDMTKLITNIKLVNVNDEVLTQSPVYVPVTQTVISKHIITVKESV